jgi:hypothetical protein
MTGAVDLTDLDMWARGVPYEEFARLRRETPVAWHDEALPNSGFWSVHCYQDILTASRDVATFSSGRGISFEEPTEFPFRSRTASNCGTSAARSWPAGSAHPPTTCCPRCCEPTWTATG